MTNDLANPTRDLDWEAFVGRHDLTWPQTPICQPDSVEPMMHGAFLGNGTLGALVYASAEPCDFPHQAIRLDVGRADIADKGGKRLDGSTWWDKWNCQNKGTRLHTGGFMLLSHGLAKVQPMALDLYHAECRTGVDTRHRGLGSIALRVLVSATSPVIAVEGLLSGEESLQPLPSSNLGEHVDYAATCRPRFVRRAMTFPGWPPCRNSVTADGIQVEVQPLLDGQEYAVAWSESLTEGKVLRLYVSLAVSPGIKSLSVGGSDPRSAAEQAVEAVRAARAAGFSAIAAEHRRWWAERWQRSAIAIPDARLEGFHLIQVYKFLASTRIAAPLPDATGPWSYAMGGPDDWAHCPGYPHIWLNLNLQMHLLIGNTSGHADQVLQVADRLLAWARRRPEWQADPAAWLSIGGGCGYDLDEGDRRDRCSIHLIWILHNCWLAARHDGGAVWAARWRELLPVLAAAVNEPLDRLRPGSDGRLHLHDSHSPEYPALPPRWPVDGRSGMTDAAYELAFLRWGVERLSADCADDPRAEHWRSVAGTLTDFAQDMFGLRISQDCTHDVGHRHFSHLTMLWPLRLWEWEDSSRQELIARSLGTWLGCPPDQKKRTGFTWAAAACVCAHLQRGDWAWGHLDTYFEERPRGTARRFGNTMAREWGFILETPLGAANAVNDMLIQSHGGVLRIFPAMPTTWAEAAFHGLAGEGGWRVSAGRSAGRTAWVRVEATVPGSIRLRHGIDAAEVVAGPGMQITADGVGEHLLNAVAGAVVLLRRSTETPPFFAPVDHKFHPGWRWGAHGAVG